MPPSERVARIEEAARRAGARILRGGPYSRWDLEISGGAVGGTRLLATIEEHGRGRQLIRSRVWPTVTRTTLRTALGLTVLSAGAALAGAWTAAAILIALLVVLVALALWECSTAMAAALAAVRDTAALELPTLPDLQAALTPRVRTLFVAGRSDS